MQATVDRRRQSLKTARMAVATVRPVKRPQALRRRALLQQQLALVVEDQQGEGAMQNTSTLMACRLVQVADLTVGFIHQDEQFGIGCDFARAGATLSTLIRHIRPAIIIVPQPSATATRYSNGLRCTRDSLLGDVKYTLHQYLA